MQQNCQNYWRKTRKMLFTPLITAELIGLLQYFKSLWAFFRIHNNIDHVGILLAMITRQSWISDFARAVGLPIICIPSAQKFSEYYLHLPGILNDPVCCMTLLTIEWSLLQRPLQQRLSVLLNGLDNLRKLPLSPWGTCTPIGTPESYPKLHLDRFSCFYRAILSRYMLSSCVHLSHAGIVPKRLNVGLRKQCSMIA